MGIEVSIQNASEQPDGEVGKLGDCRITDLKAQGAPAELALVGIEALCKRGKFLREEAT